MSKTSIIVANIILALFWVPQVMLLILWTYTGIDLVRDGQRAEALGAVALIAFFVQWVLTGFFYEYRDK